MEIQVPRFSLLLLLVCALFLGCSKDDMPGVSAIIESHTVSRYQVVTLTVNNSLTENSYQGTIGGIPVTLYRSTENTLGFMVPATAALGSHDLTIPALANTVVHYKIEDTVLTDTPENTLAQFSNNMESFASTFASSPYYTQAQDAFASYDNIYAHATADELRTMALIYKANSFALNQLLLNDVTVAGRFISPSTKQIIRKIIATVYLLGTSVVIMSAGGPIGFALGAATAATGAVLLLSLMDDLREQGIIPEKAEINNQLGRFESNAPNSLLSLRDNALTVWPLRISQRTLTESDRNNPNQQLHSFFSSFDIYNTLITFINEKISWANANIPFASYSLFSYATLPAAAQGLTTAVDQEIFSKMHFSINGSNLQLVSATLAASGQMNIHVKIMGSPTSFPVQNNLSYTYTDEVSSISGSFPLEVEFNPEGYWSLESYGGILAGEHDVQYVSGCPTIPAAQTTINSTLNFTEANVTYDYTMVFEIFGVHVLPETCTLTTPTQPTTQNTHDNFNAAYNVSGNTINVSGNGTMQIISLNKISYGDGIYKR